MAPRGLQPSLLILAIASFSVASLRNQPQRTARLSRIIHPKASLLTYSSRSAGDVRLRRCGERCWNPTFGSPLGQIRGNRGTSCYARKKKGGKNGVNRSERLEVIYQRILEFEFEYGLTDPKLESTQLVNVEMQNQLSVVRIYVTGDSQQSAEIKDALKRAKGYLRSQMSREVPIMRTPDIKFIFLPVAMNRPEGQTSENALDKDEYDYDKDYIDSEEEWEDYEMGLNQDEFGSVMENMMSSTRDAQEGFRRNL